MLDPRKLWRKVPCQLHVTPKKLWTGAYLTRYLTGGPISDHRILSADEQSVTFMAREGKRVGGERKQVPITLSICEFMKRWCLHILPEQLTRTRYFGGWSNNRSVKYMARCEEILRQLGRIKTDDDVEELAGDNGLGLPETSEDEAGLSCPHCGSTALELLSDTPKPSWREVLWRESETCPPMVRRATKGRSPSLLDGGVW